MTDLTIEELIEWIDTGFGDDDKRDAIIASLKELQSIRSAEMPVERVMKADELWEKYADDIREGEKMVPFNAFLAALKEYGEAVRAEAVKVCEKLDETGTVLTKNTTLIANALDCAAAISKMELP